jgi:tetratricopeptide (TPR) repeat protein
MKLRSYLLLVILLSYCGILFASGDQWVQVSSEHFTVVTNSSEKEGRRLLEQMERMRWAFQRLFPKMNADPDEPILVMAVKNRKSFEPLEPKEALAKGNADLAAFFQHSNNHNSVLLRLDVEAEHPYDVIYREYARLLFSKYESWIPVWFNEGVAEFYQNTVFHNKDVVVGRPSVNDVQFLRQNELIPLATLFAVDQHSPYFHDEGRSNIFYAESWALTHMLLAQDNLQKTDKVHQYLVRMSNREDPVAAAEAAFGSLSSLQVQLSNYVHGGEYREFTLSTAEAPLDDTSYKVKSLSLTEAEAVKARFLSEVGRRDEAVEILNGLLKSEPENISACQTLAEIDAQQGNVPEALKLYAVAVQHGASEPWVLMRYARLILATGSSTLNVGKAETVLRAAIQQNPKFAPAYDQLAGLLRMNPKQMAESLSLEKEAARLDPANAHYPLTVANILISQGKTDEARSVLQEALKNAANPSDRQEISTRIEQINAQAQTREVTKTEAVREEVTTNAEEVTPVAPTGAPKHKKDPATGPSHTVEGVILGVTCNYPAQMDLILDAPEKKYALYSMNYMKIDFSVLNFKATDKLDPCSMMGGLRAQIVYAEVSDDTADGQILSILLKK